MKTPLDTNLEYKAVVFFDGICGLCNGFVNFLLKADKKRNLRFAPLQGSVFQECCKNPAFQERVSSFVHLGSAEEKAVFTSVFYWEPHFASQQPSSKGKVWVESDAAIKSLHALGGAWFLLLVLRIIPKGIRNGVYRVISKNRYKWFGKRSTCRVPRIEERERFLS